MSAVEDAERRQVQAIGQHIGFGRVMQLCEEIWRERDPIGALTVGPPALYADAEKRVDTSLAKQLQASMERNARMVSRLKKIRETPSLSYVGIDRAIAAILRDEEP